MQRVGRGDSERCLDRSRCAWGSGIAAALDLQEHGPARPGLVDRGADAASGTVEPDAEERRLFFVGDAVAVPRRHRPRRRRPAEQPAHGRRAAGEGGLAAQAAVTGMAQPRRGRPAAIRTRWPDQIPTALGSSGVRCRAKSAHVICVVRPSAG